MTAPSHASPAARFLGADAALGGPFALLGLRPGVADDATVIAALERRLENLASHPQSETPEADEVRLALHAAAAQLLDPAVRVHLARRWGGESAARTAATAEPGTKMARDVLLEHDALLTLARYGGWGQRSLHRLMLLARAREATPEELLHAIERLGSRRPADRSGQSSVHPPVPVRLAGLPKPLAEAPPLPADPRPPEQPRPEDDDPGQRLLRRGVFVFVGGFLALAVLAILGSLVAIMLTAPRIESLAADAPSPPARATSPPGRVEPFPHAEADQATDDRPRAPQSEGATAASILAGAIRGLEAATEGLSVDPDEALAVFASAVHDLAANWCLLAPDRQRAAANAVVEFMHRSTAWPAVATGAAEAISAGAAAMHEGAAPSSPDEIWPAAWSVGILVRLSRERDIAGAAKSVVEHSLRHAIGGARPAEGLTFEAGVVSALSVLPRRFVVGDRPAPEADIQRWRRWTRAVDAVSGEASARRIDLLLAGLDAMVLLGPSPTTDSVVEDAMTELTLALTWRRGDRSRLWLAQAFDNPRVSVDALHTITTVLATRSGAEGVDPLMALPRGAGESHRRELRNRYETAWGLPTAAERDRLADRWIDALKASVRVSAEPLKPTDHLARAAVASRLNAAAWMRWNGDLEGAGTILNDLDAPVRAALGQHQPRGGPDGITPAPGDGAWALRYLSAQRDPDARLAALRQIQPRSRLDPIAGSVLAQEAVRGSPAQVRLAARDAMQMQRGSAPAVKGLLEQAPTMPRTIQNAELVAQVTGTTVISVRDPDWKLKTRRVLVERLLELLAAEGEMGRIDRLAPLLAEAYADQTRPAAAGPASAAEGTPGAADESAAKLRAHWQQLASEVSAGQAGVVRPEEIERRRAARLALAGGPVRRFAVEQFAIAELMGAVVAVEHPERAADADRVLASLAEARARASDILEQIAATELAISHLWALRFGEEVP